MDIKESKEFLEGLFALNKVLGPILKDGAQWADAALLFAALNDAEVKEKIAAAVAGAGVIPEELKEVKWDEGYELGSLLIKNLPSAAAAWKKS